MELIVLPVLAILAALGFSGVRVTSSSRSMLVERLGKYNRQLKPGLSLVLPGRTGARVGDRVHVAVDPSKAHLFDAGTQQRLE